MNNDQFKGQWKQFKGELKNKWGQLTDDDLLEAEGDYDKFLGIIQKRYGDKQEELKTGRKIGILSGSGMRSRREKRPSREIKSSG